MIKTKVPKHQETDSGILLQKEPLIISNTHKVWSSRRYLQFDISIRYMYVLPGVNLTTSILRIACVSDVISCVLTCVVGGNKLEIITVNSILKLLFWEPSTGRYQTKTNNSVVRTTVDALALRQHKNTPPAPPPDHEFYHAVCLYNMHLVLVVRLKSHTHSASFDAMLGVNRVTCVETIASKASSHVVLCM